MAYNHNRPQHDSRSASPTPPPASKNWYEEITLNPLPVDLFDTIAQKTALRVYEAGNALKGKNQYTQLRKFYDELGMWHDKVHAPDGLAETHGISAQRQARYEQAAPFIRMMVAKVAYAKARNHVEDTFEQLFTHLVRSIQDPITLQNAKLYMEAFMGFYRVHSK